MTTEEGNEYAIVCRYKQLLEESEASRAVLIEALRRIISGLVPYSPVSDEGIAVNLAEKALASQPTSLLLDVVKAVDALDDAIAEFGFDHLIIDRSTQGMHDALTAWRKWRDGK